MKKIFLSSSIAAALCCTISVHAQTTSPEQLVVPLSAPGKAYSLKIGLVNGSIKATGYSGSEIIIEVSARDKNRREQVTEAGNGMKKISPKYAFDITAREENNKVTVNNNDVNRIVDITLKIPQDVKLTLSTVNNGEIEVTGIKGQLEINNVNGPIKLTTINGSVVATTVNGDVTATFNGIDNATPMAFTTLNGNVDVSFPSTAKSNLKLKSDRGEIFTDFDIDIDKTVPKTEQRNGSGMYQIKLDDWIIGKINGGGPEVLMKNMNGNIYVRKAK